MEACFKKQAMQKALKDLYVLLTFKKHSKLYKTLRAFNVTFDPRRAQACLNLCCVSNRVSFGAACGFHIELTAFHFC